MQNVILFDDSVVRENLLPLTFTRPVADIRVGIDTITQKWQRLFPDANVSHITTNYLRRKYVPRIEPDSLFIASHFLPDDELFAEVSSLSVGSALKYDDELVAYRGSYSDFSAQSFDSVVYKEKKLLGIRMLYDIFLLNGAEIEKDFMRITRNRESQSIGESNMIIGNLVDENGEPRLFVEPGAVVEGAVLNLKNGPIYIGANAEIMEGACIRAPFAACEHSVVNMGARVYGATTIGPYCKIGGEVNNIVMFGYSNKAHDGFLGNAVIGEWCNIGGGTTASNLKNDYSEIKLWNYPARRFLRTGLQFCGLIMGDHSKLGVNSMINTATVIGVGVNIHGTGFPRNFVASFSEGGSSGFSDVPLSKFFTIAERMMARRNKMLGEVDRDIFESIYSIADNYK